MSKVKTTKRTLLVSVLALALCFAMLTGTTFAWFTDTETSSGNKIVAGNLDVQLLLWNGNGETMIDIGESSAPIFTAEAEAGEILVADNSLNTIWEPGKTQVAYLAIKNNGNLDLKYMVNLDTRDIDAEQNLYEVMEYVIVRDAKFGKNADGTDLAWYDDAKKSVELGVHPVSDVVNLEVGVTHYFALAIHMDELAGNQYQGGMVEFDINVVATQLNAEEDAFDANYDENAEFPVVNVATSAELVAAIAEGGNVVLQSDIAVDTAINVEGKVVINLNGYELDASNVVSDRPFHMTEGADLTINAEGTTVAIGDYGLINVPATVENASITINGGTFEGNSANGTLVRLRQGNKTVNVELNNVTYIDPNGFAFSSDAFDGEGTLVVNGGVFNTKFGFDIYELDVTIKDAKITASGVGVSASRDSHVTVDNCEITAGSLTVGNAPGAGAVACNNGTLTIKNSSISGITSAAYRTYTSGGTIIAENNVVADGLRVSMIDDSTNGVITIN